MGALMNQRISGDREDLNREDLDLDDLNQPLLSTRELGKAFKHNLH